ncbi:hypothetical protein NQ318_002728 [Aromia moschata]|uniref:Androgen-dependent TFPI-regulating protein n=1 Tax=Aromia moschata TaxID=1265417 RepID=A0AAV8Y325_9CUCU|nr:hypothetical protein NQ318_002728 [Aromia moschata]
MLQNKYVGLILYVFLTIVYIVSLCGLAGIGTHLKKEILDSIDDKIKSLAKFQPYYFTIWNFVLQIVFSVTAILDESAKLLNLPIHIRKRLGRTRAVLFNALLFPCTLLVATVFWGIWHIDRELIFPKIIDEFFPTWLNHAVHTFIVVPLIVELLLPKQYSFVQFRNAAIVLTVYAAIYQGLYVWVYLRHGVWLYPIYKFMNWTERLIFTLVQLAVGLGYLKIGITLQNRKRAKIEKVR